MKKLLSVLSSTLQGGLRGGLLFLALLTASSLWAQRFQVGDLYYNITSDTVPYTVEVTYQYKESDINYSGFAEIIIPSSITYNNITYNVTRIGDYAFYKCSSLASITIPNSVTSIGGATFYDCKSLTFTIPDGVTSIGGSAFYGCSSITSISIPESVTSIGVSAFEGTGYYNDKSNWENGNVLYIDNCLIEANYSLSGEYTIKDSTRLLAGNAFYGCYKLTSITFPESITSIGPKAFDICTSLTSVVWNVINCEDFNKDNNPFYGLTNITSFTFGDNVEHIPAYLCRNKGNLLSITIPNSVTSIGKGAFFGCSSLSSITIPNSVTSIGEYAFYDCSSLASVIIGNSVKSIGNEAFYNCSFLTTITIPNSVTSIGNYVFSSCSSLTSVTIPNSVTSIGEYAFYNCSSLTSITLTASTMEAFCHGTANQLIDLEIYRNIQIDGNEVTEIVIPESVDSIQSKAFYMCNISSVEISDGVTSIGKNAFTDCPSLTSITIPNSVTSIGIGAFSYCTALTSFSVPKSVSKIEEYTFYNCSSLSFIDISNSVTSISPNAFSGCSSLSSVHWNATNYEISRSSYAPFYNILTQITSFTFGDAVDSIPTYLCYGMENLQSLTIGNSVTSIGDYAFYKCSAITSVTIPNSVTSIGDDAFSYCSSLTSVTIGNSVTSIGEYAFSYCSSLTSVTIPNSVTSIGKRAFSGCSSLTSVTIPNSVTSIGENAFSGCSSLTSVHWNATNYEISSSSDAPFYNILTQITSFTFGDAVESIPAYLCYGMENLQSVVIPNSVTSIGESAFSYCSSLTSVTIPNSVTSIGERAFSYCSSLTSITLTADSMEEYLNGYTNKLCYYYGSSLKSAKRHLLIDNEIITNVVIPENIDTINSYAFYNCSDIRSLTLHDNVYLNGIPFSGCDSIQSITITAPSIEQYCQSTINDNLYDNKLTNAERNIIIAGQKVAGLVIPESITTISENLFYNSTSLTSLTLPNSVASVKKGAFYGCKNLDAIYQTSSTPPTIGTTVFSSFPVCYIPYGSLTAYKESSWAAQVSKFVEEPITGYQIYYTSSDGNIVTPSAADPFNATVFSNVYENGQGIITFNGPVHTIKTGAFLNCSTLTSITIPFSIEHIEDRAFANCSALGVVDVKCITPPTLGEEAFTSAPTCYIPCGTKHFYDVSTWAEQANDFIVEDCGGKQIFYTTVDGGIITPSTADLGANLVSNVYEFGQGIMTFDAPVTHMAGFSNCNTLTSITIPESVTSVGGDCFAGCSLLTSIVWNAKHVEQVKWGGGSWLGASLPAYDMFEGVRSQITSFVFGESVEYIPDYLCYYMENLREIIIPESVQGISKYAFSRCSALTSAVIGNNVKTIGEHAFSYCSSLTSATIGKSVITIGEEAFRDCSALTSIVIPDSVLAIENSTFFNCSALTSVTLNNSLISIYDYAFMDCSSLTSITIPEDVTYIGDRVFYNCSALTSVTWNARHCNDFLSYDSYSDVYKPEQKFEGCSITSFIISENVEKLPASLCYKMSDLQSITIPEKVNMIGDYTFDGCTSLTSITIPENVYSIGASAFNGCSSLTSITLPENLYSMGERAFYGCSSLTSITIPENISSIGGYAFSYCSSLKTVAWNAINTGDILNSYSYTCTPFSSSPIETLVIGDKVTYIPERFCEECPTLASVTIGKNIEEIGYYAFYNCTSLTQTNYTGNIASWCQIAFGGFSSNPTYYSKNLFINGEEVKDVVIPNTVTSISTNAFYNCEKISSLTIPESVTSIGYNAFAGCKKLFDIYCYPTTPPEAQENSFTNYNVNLYVPCESLKDYQMDMVFGSFKYIQCLEDTPPSEPQDTTIYHPIEYAIICEGETYVWWGMTYTEADAYTYVEIVEEEDYIYHNIYTLELTVQPSETVVLVEEAYDSFEWHGIVYTESGSYFYEEWCYQEILELTIIPSEDNQGEVVVEPSTNSVTITWQKEDDADTYIIVIKQGDKVVCTLIFDAEGNLVSINYLPGRESNKHGIQHAGLTSDSFQYTITGLTPSTDYTYTVTATDDSDNTISSYSGEFTTHHATSVENTNSQSPTIDCQKILYEDHIYILRDGKIYSIMGQEMQFRVQRKLRYSLVNPLYCSFKHTHAGRLTRLPACCIVLYIPPFSSNYTKGKYILKKYKKICTIQKKSLPLQKFCSVN